MITLSKQEVVLLEAERVGLELEIAKGQELPETLPRLHEIDRLLEESNWTFDLDSAEYVVKHPNVVCRSAAGFYIGVMSEDGPYSRESAEYWSTKEKAQIALETGRWTKHNYDI